MALPMIPPWRQREHKDPVSPNTLKDWRKLAAWYARTRGAKFACHICKRPVNLRGYVRIKPPQGGVRERKICMGCWLTLGAYLDHLESTMALDMLPIEAIFPVSPEEPNADQE